MPNNSVSFQPSGITVNVPAGTLLSDAAIQAGIPLRNDCGGQGLCKKCLVDIISPTASSLGCRYKVEQDIEVFIPEQSLRQNTQQLVIQEKNFISDILDKAVVKRNAKYGIALDIGTTTLAAELYQLQQTQLTESVCSPKLLASVSRANSQRQYGADVISRIQKVLENSDSFAALHKCITDDVKAMLFELSEKSGVPAEHFEVLSAAGNTVMEYLFLGIDPSPLGYAPFEAPVKRFPVISKPQIIYQLQIETMPLYGGFVGGDIVADTLALGLADKQETSFLIDIGTNGELALFSNGKVITAATAAGPCFEGGGITCGTLALPGAISGVKINSSKIGEDGGIALTTIGNKKPNGICGSGLIEAVSELLRCGIIGTSGKFTDKKHSPFVLSQIRHTETRRTQRKEINSEIDNETSVSFVSPYETNIVLTQADIRQFQLAAGAIRSGIFLLLKRQGLTLNDIDTFYIAGGFGSYIKAEAAQRTGLIPKELPLEKIRFCGNTSLAGAALALFDEEYRIKGERIAERAEHIGLESLPNFAEVFADNMRF